MGMKDPLGYGGKKVVVTGAASGMGAATAEILAQNGADVRSIDIKPSPVDGVTSMVVDLRDKTAIDGAVAEIGAGVQAVFSVAGLPGPPFSDYDTMVVNAVGCRHLIESIVPGMPAGGAISCVASNAGLGWQQNLEALMPIVQIVGFDEGCEWLKANQAAYAGNAYGFSKQVLNAWVAWRAIGLLPQQIRLNVTNPGPTQTAMMPAFEAAAGADLINAFIGPIGRRSSSEEQAWPLVFLNSPHMTYVTGEAIHVDGGFLAATVTGQYDTTKIMEEALARMAAASQGSGS